ncbi:hypothetical protein [Vagococcus penaei]|uniref:hypothetical protein n=1 Tax=Vagococcus penaei TaxID=633807 RepID=UPI0014716F62|nr:hypothetical protein [Vagococcus penaei]
MEEKDWLLGEVDDLITSSRSYIEKATFLELKEIIIEQYQRIEQANAELDGTLWSPKNW